MAFLHSLLRRRVNLLSVFIYFKTLLSIVLFIIQTFVQINIVKFLHFGSLLSNFTKLVLQNVFDSLKYFYLRVEVFITKIETLFVHVLKDRVDFVCWPLPYVAYDFSRIEIAFLAFPHP